MSAAEAAQLRTIDRLNRALIHADKRLQDVWESLEDRGQLTFSERTFIDDARLTIKRARAGEDV